jgi:hypothetical protein
MLASYVMRWDMQQGRKGKERKGKERKRERKEKY